MDDENHIILKNEELDEINKNLGVPNYFEKAEILYIDHIKKNLMAFVKVLARDNISYIYEEWGCPTWLIFAAKFDPRIKKFVDTYKEYADRNYQNLKKEVPEIIPADVISPIILIKETFALHKDTITKNFTKWQKES